METQKTVLPYYTKPPVNEVVFGIQFKKIQDFKAPHTGILWESFGRKKYPQCKEMPPISHTIENFDAVPTKTSPIIIEDIIRPPLPRIFFISEEKKHLIQIQEDRLHLNWRKLKTQDEYPRYNNLYPKFQEYWSSFITFIKDMNLGSVEPDQYELTYVNHIPRGDGWVDISKLEDVFKHIQPNVNTDFLPKPENVSWRFSYVLPNNSGRLHVSIRIAVNKESNNQIIIFDLTARGFIPDKIDSWFGMAHEWIVKGFTDLTTSYTQDTIWRRKN
ncbi:MAG: TIGR04255 family protein [Sedimentisphaerales bacterium]|nr:TIGR04255 family protein [Sedimentisphaerales bacterium]